MFEIRYVILGKNSEAVDTERIYLRSLSRQMLLYFLLPLIIVDKPKGMIDMKKIFTLLFILALSLAVTVSSLADPSLVTLEKVNLFYKDGTVVTQYPSQASGNLVFSTDPTKEINRVSIVLILKTTIYVDFLNDPDPPLREAATPSYPITLSINLYDGESVIVRLDAEDGPILFSATVSPGEAPNPPPTLPADSRPRDDGNSLPTGPDGVPAKIGRCREWVNVRSGPGTSHSIVGRAYLGEAIRLLRWNEDETWGRVIYNNNGNAGWVYQKFIIPGK